MNIRDCMKKKVVSIKISDTVQQAAKYFVSKHVGMLPVVDKKNKLVGLVQLRDLIILAMPNFIKLVDDFDFVHDFGAMESSQPPAESLTWTMDKVMQPPICIEETCGLTRAFALLREYDLTDIPVVDVKRRLTGIASRVDIGVALLSIWKPTMEKKEE